MEHNHDHNHNHNSKENIKIAFLLNLMFSMLELFGGFLTNSISILTDSIHDFGDALSIGVSYFLEKKSSKTPDQEYTYGYLRYSLIGALLTSVILLIGSLIAVIEAVKRIKSPQTVNYDAMIIFAIFGIIINGYAAHKTSHGHKHNEKAINLHMIEDVFGWVVVFIGSICIKIFDFHVLDSILSIFIAMYILFHVYKYIKEVFDIFMEKVPSNIKIDKITKDVEQEFSEIKSIHHIHIWTMDGTNNYMTCHIALNKKLEEKQITDLKHNIKVFLKEYDIDHITLEIEYKDEECDNKRC